MTAALTRYLKDFSTPAPPPAPVAVFELDNDFHFEPAPAEPGIDIDAERAAAFADGRAEGEAASDERWNSERAQLIAEHEAALAALRDEFERETAARLTANLEHSESLLASSRASLEEIRRSVSWTLTKPLRFLSRLARGRRGEALVSLRNYLHQVGRTIYWRVPVAQRERLLLAAYRHFGFAFKGLGHYERWKRQLDQQVQPQALQNIAIHRDAGDCVPKHHIKSFRRNGFNPPVANSENGAIGEDAQRVLIGLGGQFVQLDEAQKMGGDIGAIRQTALNCAIDIPHAPGALIHKVNRTPGQQ